MGYYANGKDWESQMYCQGRMSMIYNMKFSKKDENCKYHEKQACCRASCIWYILISLFAYKNGLGRYTPKCK